MVVRKAVAVAARAAITAANRVAASPPGPGGASWEARADSWSAAATEASSPCWICARALLLPGEGTKRSLAPLVEDHGSLGMAGASRTRAASCEPVWVDARATREASSPHPRAVICRSDADWALISATEAMTRASTTATTSQATTTRPIGRRPGPRPRR